MSSADRGASQPASATAPATESEPAHSASPSATLDTGSQRVNISQAGQPLASSSNSNPPTDTAAAAAATDATAPISQQAASATPEIPRPIVTFDPALPVQTDDTIEANEGSVNSDEFEPEDWDEGGVSTASTSINSSVYAHEFENGRRYHSYKNGRYPIPNDDQEQNREDMKHVMMLEMTDGKLCYSPIGDNPQKIIDIGTGTGLWAIEAGDRYPSASILGIDLSPIQPLWIPPNVKFVIDDCEDEWANGDNYDLVHLRVMSPVLKDVPKMCRQAFANIKPGGWMEWQELHGWMQCDDGSMPADDPAYEIYRLVGQAFHKMGFDIHLAAGLGEPLREAGFVNVSCVVKKIPVGTWARDRRLRLVGYYLKTVIQEFLPALAGRPLMKLDMNEVERSLLRAAAHKALDDMTVHRYWNFYFWHGQKPY